MTWEQRWHPLRQEWVVVAAHRQDRPWHGETARPAVTSAPAWDPTCHLCPRVKRVSGAVNADYTSTYVFDNDRPPVGTAAPSVTAPVAPPLRTRRADGVARVLCFHPDHSLALARLGPAGVAAVVRLWQEQTAELASRPEVASVLAFENRGQLTGVSNPHPHGQLYATNFVMPTFEVERAAAAAHHARTGRSLLADVVAAEREAGTRIVDDAGTAVAFLPHFARYAYELFVAPERPVATLAELGDDEVEAFAAVLHRTLVRLDNLWQLPFPYVLAVHQAPVDGSASPGFHAHVELHPPLRKPHLRKHLAGPEIGGGAFVADTVPEERAEELRAVSTVHYADGASAVSRP